VELACRGLTGRSPYRCLRGEPQQREGARATIPYRRGIRIDEATTINQPLEPLYHFWRQLDNLPYFMEHLQSVNVIDEKRSHWMAKGPAGRQVEWDAEIVNEVPNKMIGWRSVAGSEIDTAGSVHFHGAPGGRGTEVRVELQYVPPGGALGAVFAKLEDAPHAYEIFRAKQDGCIKVVLDPWRTDQAISTFQAADNALAESIHSESKEVV